MSREGEDKHNKKWGCQDNNVIIVGMSEKKKSERVQVVVLQL